MNWKAVILAIGATLVDPITVTVNEIAESVDDIEKTVLNADFIVRAWGRWLTIVLGGGYLLATREPTNTHDRQSATDHE